MTKNIVLSIEEKENNLTMIKIKDSAGLSLTELARILILYGQKLYDDHLTHHHNHEGEVNDN